MSDRVDHMRAVLPRGNSLDDGAWYPRHRLLLWLLTAHVPALVAVGMLAGRSWAHVAPEIAPVAAAGIVAIVARSRVARSMAATLGLVGSATILVHFSGGLVEAHFHYFVVLGFIALYQDWRPYLIAVAYVVVGHGLIGVLAPDAIYGQRELGTQPWLWAAIQGVFVLAVSVAHLLFWKQTERQQSAARDYYTRLYEGERAVVAELRKAQTVKDELIGVVGHEFRTPLASIQGFARTLDARYDRMDRDAVQTCTQAIEREAKRLTRMVANLLTASEDIVGSPDDRCPLQKTVAEVVGDVIETAPMAARNVRTQVAQAHVVRAKTEDVHLLLFNLLDNAVKFAVPDSDVRLTTRREGDMVVVEVSNVGAPILQADQERIFDAFVQSDSSDTRRYGGIGLGLHIARRIAEAYGGRIGAYSDGPVTIFRAWLPWAPMRKSPVARPARPVVLPEDVINPALH